MADNTINRINSEIHSPGFEIKPMLLAQILLEAIGPFLLEPDPRAFPRSQTSRAATEPTPRT